MAAARPTPVWAKAGAAAPVMEADLATCDDGARAVHASANTYMVSVNPIAMAGAALIMGISAGIAEHKAKVSYVRHCMRRAGYVAIPMTASEEADFKARRTPDEMKVWLADFYAAPNFPGRLATALTPAAPPLAAATPEAFVYGGVRLDPATFSASAVAVPAGGVILSGKALHRRTARLRAAINLSQYGDVPEAGTVFHQVVLPGEDEPAETFWCMPEDHNIVFTKATSMACLSSDEEGYTLQRAMGRPWLASALQPNAAPSRLRLAVVDLDPGAEDQIGPMNFALRLKKIGKTGVEIEAALARDGQLLVFWTGEFGFNPAGVAVVPFWAHRLTLSRTPDGAAVWAKFTPDGDGAAWDGSPPA